MAWGWLLGEKPCRACACTSTPSFLRGLQAEPTAFHVKQLQDGRGSPLALLAITDLQFFLLEEQGLSTEFTLNRAEGVSLLCERKIHASF